MVWLPVCLVLVIFTQEQSQTTATPQRQAPLVSSQKGGVESGAQTVYVTRTGRKYHRSECRYLSKSKIPISLKNAVVMYSPCSVCKPPVLGRSRYRYPRKVRCPTRAAVRPSPEVSGFKRKNRTFLLPNLSKGNILAIKDKQGVTLAVIRKCQSGAETCVRKSRTHPFCA